MKEDKHVRIHPNLLKNHVVECMQMQAYGRTPVDYSNRDHKPKQCRAPTEQQQQLLLIAKDVLLDTDFDAELPADD